MNVRMFVYYFTHLAGAAEQWARRLETIDEAIPGMAAAAVRASMILDDSLESRLTLGGPVRSRGSTLFAFTWTVPGLFQDMDGDLQVEPVDPHYSQLTLRASYVAGPRQDEHQTHRLVEGVVKRFVDSMAALDAGEGASTLPGAV